MENKMPIIVALFLILSFLSTDAFALKCDKCHKDEKSLDKLFDEKAIKTKQELIEILRNGNKAKLHKNLTDDDINESAKKMNLK